MSSAATKKLAFVMPAEKRQAEYFVALLGQRWADVAELIARDHAALSARREGRDRRHARRVLRRIAENRREQFALEGLRKQLERRFFGGAATPDSIAALGRCFDVSVERHGSWWKVAIPELGEHVSARRREDAETAARAHISALLEAPMFEVAVRFLGTH